jgi:hypothetical protein
VCWTIEDQIEWVRWAHAVNENWWAVAHCPYVIEVVE